MGEKELTGMCWCVCETVISKGQCLLSCHGGVGGRKYVVEDPFDELIME